MNHTQNLACWAHNFAQAPDFCLDVFTSFVDREIDDRGPCDVVNRPRRAQAQIAACAVR